MGKTELVNAFQRHGYSVLDEGFMGNPPSLLHPQSLLMETAWVCGWFQRLMDSILARRKTNQAGPALLVADRSPASAMFYARSHGTLLAPLIQRYIEELHDVGVHVLVAHVTVEKEALWRRICARLEVEPHRISLNEDSRDWMEQSLAFYCSQPWDVCVDNGDGRSVLGTAARVMAALAVCPSTARSPDVRRRLADAAGVLAAKEQEESPAVGSGAGFAGVALSPALQAASAISAAAACTPVQAARMARSLSFSSASSSEGAGAAPLPSSRPGFPASPSPPPAGLGSSPTQPLSDAAVQALAAQYGYSGPALMGMAGPVAAGPRY